MKKSVSKKVEKVIKEELEEMTQRTSLREVTTIGARMVLRVAIVEEVTAPYPQRDYNLQSPEQWQSSHHSR